jgi:hypothetical protein
LLIPLIYGTLRTTERVVRSVFCYKGIIMQRRTVLGLFATTLLMSCGVFTPPALTGPALLVVYTNG